MNTYWISYQVLMLDPYHVCVVGDCAIAPDGGFTEGIRQFQDEVNKATSEKIGIPVSQLTCQILAVVPIEPGRELC